MKYFTAYVVPAVFFCCAFNVFRGGYGTRWKLGKYGIPCSLVSADGWAYLDGSAVDPLTRLLVLSGCEQLFYLAVLLVIMVCVIGIVLLMRNIARTRRRILELQTLQTEFDARRRYGNPTSSAKLT